MSGIVPDGQSLHSFDGDIYWSKPHITLAIEFVANSSLIHWLKLSFSTQAVPKVFGYSH